MQELHGRGRGSSGVVDYATLISRTSLCLKVVMRVCMCAAFACLRIPHRVTSSKQEVFGGGSVGCVGCGGGWL